MQVKIRYNHHSDTRIVTYHVSGIPEAPEFEQVAAYLSTHCVIAVQFAEPKVELW